MDIDHVKTLLDYNPETGNFVWLKAKRRVLVGRRAGTPSVPNGHLNIGVQGQRIGAHRLAWAFHTGQFPKGEIDHIDGNPQNNAIGNLRDVTHAQNMLNLRTYKNNTSGFKGVSLHRQSGLWCARIKAEGKYHSLGLHRTPEAASDAYAAASARFHGEYGRPR